MTPQSIRSTINARAASAARATEQTRRRNSLPNSGFAFHPTSSDWAEFPADADSYVASSSRTRQPGLGPFGLAASNLHFAVSTGRELVQRTIEPGHRHGCRLWRRVARRPIPRPSAKRRCRIPRREKLAEWDTVFGTREAGRIACADSQSGNPRSSSIRLGCRPSTERQKRGSASEWRSFG